MKRNKKMNSETIQDIADRRIAANILNLDEIEDAKERERQIRMSARSNKPKRIPAWKARYQMKEPDETDLSIEKNFISLFRRSVRERFPDVKLVPNSLYNMEIRSVSLALDRLQTSGSRNNQTISSWVEWYVARMKPKDVDKKLVSVKWLTDSWKDFFKVRPKGNQIDQAPVVAKPNDVIGARLAELFGSGMTIESICMACQIFGVVIVGNFMKSFNGNERTVELMKLAIESTNDSTLNMIFGATCRYSVGKAARKGVFMLDWENLLPRLVPTNNDRPFPAESQAKYVDIFFEGCNR